MYARFCAYCYTISPNALTRQQGKLQLLVKWKGYDDPADRTWEPEENLK